MRSGDDTAARRTLLWRSRVRRDERQVDIATALGPDGASVEIPDAGFRIAGYIDRLDISGDGRRALVRDYKTGRPPKDSIVLDGGKELQRCLYAFAVKALLGDGRRRSALRCSIFATRSICRLADPEATLIEVAGYLRAARANLSPATV